MSALDYIEDLDPTLRRIMSGARRARVPAAAALTPEEQESLMSAALNKGVSGLQWAGESLDKPARTARALLYDEGGHFDPLGASLSDLAHLIPFSDTIGITDDEGWLGGTALQVADKDSVANESQLRENLGWTVETGNPWVDVPANLGIDVGLGIAHDPFFLGLVKGPAKALTAAGRALEQSGSRAAQGLDFAGELAQAGRQTVMGTTPARMADEIRQGQRGLFSIAGVPMGTEGGAIDTTLKALGMGGSASLYESAFYNPISAGVRQLFDTRVKDIHGATAQREADLLTSKAIDTAAVITDSTLAIKKRTNELSDEFTHTVKAWMDERPDVFRAITGGLEGGNMTPDEFVRAIGELKGGNLRSVVDELDGIAKTASNSASIPVMITNKMRSDLAAKGFTPEQVSKMTPQDAWNALGGAAGAARRTPDEVLASIDKFDEVAAAARDMQDKAMERFHSLGGDITPLVDEFSEHFHRRISDELKDFYPRGKSLERATDGVTGAIHRSIRDVPGGTYKVNAMTRDPEITAWGALVPDKAAHDAALAKAAQKIESVYGVTRKPILDENGAQVIGKDGQPMFDDTPEEMARWLAKMPDKVLETGLFGRSFITDMADYTLRMERKSNALDATYRLLAEVAQPGDDLGPTVAEILGHTGKVQRWKDAGGRWRSKVEKGEINVTEDGVKEFSRRWAEKHGGQAADINALRVPHVFKDAIEKLNRYYVKPEEAHGMIRAYDKALGLTKASLYSPWPASHVRNGISGLWQNMVTAFTNPAAGLRAIGEANAAMHGNGNAEWLEAFKAHGGLEGGVMDDIIKLNRGMNSEVPTGSGMEILGDVFLGTAKNIKNAATHPFQSAKQFWTDGGAEFGPFKAGRKVGEGIEFINRYSHFAALKERGWSNAAAMRSVKLSHFDYTANTAAEATVFKRLIPFYRFIRSNLPAQLRNLIDEPGGRTAQTIRGVNLLREQGKDRNKGQYTPNYLAEGLAFPIEDDNPNDNERTFFQSRGVLPIEEAFNRFPMFGNMPDWKHIAENIGATLTPAISAPAQAMSGRQWWSHRDLDDLHQEPFDNEIANFWVYSSPASRALSTARMLHDDRKSGLQRFINALVGGAKFTTVDIPKWMRIEAREVLERELKNEAGVREFSKLYASDVERLSPEAVAQLSMLEAVQRELTKLNKERRKEK